MLDVQCSIWGFPQALASPFSSVKLRFRQYNPSSGASARLQAFVLVLENTKEIDDEDDQIDGGASTHAILRKAIMRIARASALTLALGCTIVFLS